MVKSGGYDRPWVGSLTFVSDLPSYIYRSSLLGIVLHGLESESIATRSKPYGQTSVASEQPVYGSKARHGNTGGSIDSFSLYEQVSTVHEFSAYRLPSTLHYTFPIGIPQTVSTPELIDMAQSLSVLPSVDALITKASLDRDSPTLG